MRNRISYLQFHHNLSPFGIFSLNDILKIYPDFDSRRLNEWQEKNYLTKLIKGWYMFNDISINENSLYQVSNSLRAPSYISLESALSFYHVIPEQAFTITAITTLKTMEYKTAKGNFSYKKIRQNLFFGYTIIPQAKGRPVLMAELEKTLLDYLYLNPKINKPDAVASLRLNKEILTSLDFKKMEIYLQRFDNKALQNRYKLLKQMIAC